MNHLNVPFDANIVVKTTADSLSGTQGFFTVGDVENNAGLKMALKHCDFDYSLSGSGNLDLKIDFSKLDSFENAEDRLISFFKSLLNYGCLSTLVIIDNTIVQGELIKTYSVFMDGGVINTQLVRDSVINRTNPISNSEGGRILDAITKIIARK